MKGKIKKYILPLQFPNLQYEKKLWGKGYIIVGIDEVGRGAFAGPLVVGAVAFEPTSSPTKIKELESLGINDSKKLTAQKREQLSKIIKKLSLAHSTATIDVKTINRVGIGKATEMGVRKVISKIKNQILKKHIKNQRYLKLQKAKNTKYLIPYTKYYLLIDAFYIKYVRGIGLKNQKAIIHGDEISLSIAAASIIAKVYRDNLMIKLSKKYPLYSLDKHKGYGTKDHRSAIVQYGKTVIHREIFIHSIKLEKRLTLV